MPFTKEEVIDKAKELGQELTENQVDAYVVINRLPSEEDFKVENSSKNSKDDKDEKDSNKNGKSKGEDNNKETDSLREIINNQKKIIDDTSKKLKELEEKENNKNKEDLKKKGQWETLTKQAEEENEKAKGALIRTKEALKSKLIATEIRQSLVEAGIDKQNLGDAEKLFDASMVTFEWDDEENLEGRAVVSKTYIDKFKKEKEYFFKDSDGNPIYNSSRPPSKGKERKEDRTKRLEKTYSALR